MQLLSLLESFVQLATTQSFAQAANRLGISSPTLTRRIQSLEKELGCVLIQRSTRRFVLTEEGHRLQRQSEHLLEGGQKIKADFSHSVSSVAGHLRVGAPYDFATSFIGPQLSAFCRSNKTLTFDLVAVRGQPDLLREGLDVAIVVVHRKRLPDSTSTLHRIGVFPRFLYASADYLAEMGTPTSIASLNKHLCIRHLDAAVEREWMLQSGSKRSPITTQGSCSVTSIINAAQAARDHLGIALLPAHLAGSSEKHTGLVRVLPDWEGLPALVFALTAHRRLHTRISAFIHYARLTFAQRLAALEKGGPIF